MWLYTHYYQDSTRASLSFQWNLVCNRTALVATAQSFKMAGEFVGIMLSGFCSDRFKIFKLSGFFLCVESARKLYINNGEAGFQFELCESATCIY